MEQFSKLSLGTNFKVFRGTLRLVPEWSKKIKNLEKMGAKFVHTTSTICKQDERKLLPQRFSPCITDVHPYKIFR